ncbi:hypothetical protein ACFSUJ_12075 [Streptomyces lusitanus]|uniref:Uncharacterized protein n=1 Tax=Streptomyces lusitanus TaxID=68232 RepID=A0ABU3JP69_9ACTN|nr:hypothetical protein [Streptomyces lusitanus]
MDVLAAVAVIVSVAAGLCGHASQPFPPARWWRAARTLWQRHRSRRALAARPLRRTPAWARPSRLPFARRTFRR